MGQWQKNINSNTTMLTLKKLPILQWNKTYNRIELLQIPLIGAVAFCGRAEKATFLL